MDNRHNTDTPKRENIRREETGKYRRRASSENKKENGDASVYILLRPAK
jgi:hypothetical protein